MWNDLGTTGYDESLHACARSGVLRPAVAPTGRPTGPGLPERWADPDTTPFTTSGSSRVSVGQEPSHAPVADHDR
ncbi:hypothetical protein OG927_30075 [Streptomyces clavifer]|uniref:hypothetical protein n=1 Tax=Streptomyces clavifer TaxID=68188 RepID=UPI002E8163F0|nr:hypothetical protein [Streptomyces clavifer]WUC31335.1 hypothetical protein OG927_30075 [Streptomyces clavifer]